LTTLVDVVLELDVEVEVVDLGDLVAGGAVVGATVLGLVEVTTVDDVVVCASAAGAIPASAAKKTTVKTRRRNMAALRCSRHDPQARHAAAPGPYPGDYLTGMIPKAAVRSPFGDAHGGPPRPRRPVSLKGR